MINEIDEALQKLLLNEAKLNSNEVDVDFHQPKREWSARLSKPTYNLFLFDIRENLRLRGAEQIRPIDLGNGSVEIRRNPTRMDLRYMLTVWTKEPTDEHYLLSQAIFGLLRNPFLPENLLPERMRNQHAPIPIDVATFIPEHGPVDKLSEIWGVLDNEIRPGILITVTIAVDPYTPEVFRKVEGHEVHLFQNQKDAPAPDSAKRSQFTQYYTLAGRINSKKYALSSLSVLFVEQNIPVEVDENGNFAIKRLQEGEYHFDISVNQKMLKRQTIVVPSADYEIHV